MNGFWRWRRLHLLNSKQADLYFAILDCFNSARWATRVTVPNSTLMSMCGLCASDLYKCRAVLSKAGLITYRSGNRMEAGSYGLVSLSECFMGSNSDSNVERNVEHIYKNKTKTKTKTKEKRAYGSRGNVFLYEDEYAALEREFPGEAPGAVECLGAYIELKGDKYRSHAAAIRKWGITAAREGKRSGGGNPRGGGGKASYDLAAIEAMEMRPDGGTFVSARGAG